MMHLQRIIGAVAVTALITIIARDIWIHREIRRQKAAVSDIFSLATAVADYAGDHRGLCPVTAATPTFVSPTREPWWAYTQSFRRLRVTSGAGAIPSDLEIYFKESRFPDRDPWGNSYLYGVDATRHHYIIICTGRDGRLDAAAPPPATEPGDVSRDIVFMDGRFFSYPRAISVEGQTPEAP